MQPTCTIIHEGCVWESREEPTEKDDSSLAAPHLLYLDIPCDFATIELPCENSFPDVSTSGRSLDTSDVSLSLQCKEDTSSSKNPFNLSSIISENTEGEHLCFPYTPFLDPSNHEDANKDPEFFLS